MNETVLTNPKRKTSTENEFLLAQLLSEMSLPEEQMDRHNSVNEQL